MASHFLLSAKARSLSIGQVLRMTDAQAEAMFAGIRWTETGGKAVCPHCACPTCYEARRPNGALRFRCKACRKDFSLTSGTLFAFHKLPLQTYLAAIVIFCNEVKGKSALALSRDLGVQYKTAFVMAHKLREAMAAEMKGCKLGGEGETVEVDGAYFGGYVKPANHKENRRDRRLAKNQNGKRQCVVVIRERDGRSLPAAFKSEGAALAYIRIHVAAGTRIHADEAERLERPAGALRGQADQPPARLQHWTAPARTGRRASLAGSAAPRSATTTTSQAPTWPATPKRARGARVTAGMDNGAQVRARGRAGAWPRGPAWTSAAIGSGPTNRH